jgi:hypothetical protein
MKKIDILLKAGYQVKANPDSTKPVLGRFDIDSVCVYVGKHISGYREHLWSQIDDGEVIQVKALSFDEAIDIAYEELIGKLQTDIETERVEYEFSVQHLENEIGKLKVE